MDKDIMENGNILSKGKSIKPNDVLEYCLSELDDVILTERKHL